MVSCSGVTVFLGNTPQSRVSCQGPADRYPQLVQPCGLRANDIDVKGLGFLCIDRVTAIRAQDNGDILAQTSHFTSQGHTSHVGHGLISYDEIEALWSGAEGLQRFKAMRIACDAVVAQVFEFSL